MKDEVLQKISSSGISGIKKAEIKKLFGKESEELLEDLKNNDQICIEKKGVAYFVWTKENYQEYATKNDPRFKLVLEMLSGVNQSIAKVQANAEFLTREFEKYLPSEKNSTNTNFEGVFNNSLSESSTSIGWVSLSKIREKVCQTQNLTKEKFYQLVSDFIENNKERYEVSSGGQEGIMIRGLVHGYVRAV